MNWLKNLWNWLVSKTSTAPELTVVEVEEEDLVGDMFDWICRECGVKPKYLEEQKIKFIESYKGSADEESVRSGMRQAADTDEYMGHLFKNRGL